MFVQIHMLQSMPPGNLNRDETGQPKKCVFGGVTRGRISSQCLKRNIRGSAQFREAFGEDRASRTLYLPRMVADALKAGKTGVPEDELGELMKALSAKFKKETRQEEGDMTDESEEKQDSAPGGASNSSDGEKTGQLVFFPPPFAHRVAELVASLRRDDNKAYSRFLGRKAKHSKEEQKQLDKRLEGFVNDVATASKRLTVDIGLFGRMTTSDLVVDIEATCQVAHAISTHETVIESDYFTAMDDRGTGPGAGYIGSGESETFYSSAVYYKYLNVDIDGLRDADHLPSLSEKNAGRVAAALTSAAAMANPTGKQNSFAAHGVPELILVEVSQTKRPLSYANAFLQAVRGDNLMAASATALTSYVDSVAAAFAPADVRRVMMAIGNASGASLKSVHESVASLDKLAAWVEARVADPEEKGQPHG
jgi:CRISPR system Cascade subunit CasC